VRNWALAVGAAFLLTAVAAPRLLHPLNRLWMGLALWLSRLTNPILTGILFYVLFTPLAWFFRRMGKDLLRLRFDPQAESYWIRRDPPGPEPDTMRYQF